MWLNPLNYLDLSIYIDSTSVPPRIQKRAVKRLCRGGDTLLSRPGRGAALRSADRRYSWQFQHSRPKGSRPQKIRFPGRSCLKRFEIALDAMGGDVGASVVIPGAAISLIRHPTPNFCCSATARRSTRSSKNIRR